MNQKLEKSLSQVLIFIPVLGYFTSGWKKIIEKSEVGTMAVDYENLYYSPEFLEDKTHEEIAAVLIHEVVHCMFLHPTEITKIQSQGKDPYLWTIALEMVTNANTIELIKTVSAPFRLPGQPYSPLSDSKPPAGPVYFHDPQAISMTAEEIYDLLSKKAKKPPVIAIGIPVSGPGTGGDQADGTEGDQRQDTETSAPLAGDVVPSEEKTQAQETIERTIAALEKLNQLTKGTMPAGMARLLKRLKNSRTPWWRILHGFIGSVIAGMNDISWQTPDFKHPASKDVVLPGPHDTEVEDIVVAVDTSGSISENHLERFAGEIAKLTQYTQDVTVITTDAEVHERVKVREARDVLTKLRFKGGGGTDFGPVFETVKKCQCMVFLTDGCATYPEKRPRYPVLWILTKEHQMPPFGKVAYILED